MNSNLRINEACVNCGCCLEEGRDFLTTSADGNVCVKTGTFISNTNIVERLNNSCPTGAFELDASIGKKSMLLELKKSLHYIKGLKVPQKKDLPFNTQEYSIPLPEVSGWNQYIYLSESAANRAALSEFKSHMYSQIDNLILKVITDYKIKYLQPYYTREAETGSVYAQINASANDIIDGINNIIDGTGLVKLEHIDIYPDRDSYSVLWKMLNRGEIFGKELISMVRNEFEYDADSYSSYWDTDDMELPVGTDLFGNTRYKTKWSYQKIDDAYLELAKDLHNALGYSKNDLAERAVSIASRLVEGYNEMLSKEIDKTEKALDNLIAGLDSI